MLPPLLPPWLFIQSTVFMCSFLSPSFGIVFLPPVSLEQITTFLYYKPNSHNLNCIEYDLTISHAIQHFQCQILLVSVHSSQSLQDYCTIKIAEYLFYLVKEVISCKSLSKGIIIVEKPPFILMKNFLPCFPPWITFDIFTWFFHSYQGMKGSVRPSKIEFSE